MNPRQILLAAVLSPPLAVPALAEAPKVVASIKPIHSLVAQVMQGVGEPGLIVDGAGSPHTYVMKPSNAAELQEAELVFWVGEQLEPFLEKPLETLAADATVVELWQAPGLETLAYREGGPFEADEHGAGDGDEDHAAGEAQDHSEEDHAEGEEEHGHAHQEADDGHGHAGIDMHLWLDPRNAKALIARIEEALSESDPENAARYQANAEAAAAALDALEAEIAAELAPVKEKPFVVFHDAYQYFENRFGLNAVGSITVSPEVAPGAERVAEIRDKVAGLGAVCVFAEPQFEPGVIATIVEGTEARSGVLDPEGAGIPNGPELYPTLLRNMAASLKGCLSETD
jgi:zinc transport system substrate-binding protein